ncbi:MAG TPA: replicative DNA helicase [Lachnospiraceae bacterium]|nr:replicative DNA helicase [Lachnospiraceae bacterium]
MAEEEVRGRVMPHSLEAEQSVIGAMLMDEEAIEAASEILTEEDFYARQYGVLFTAITEMHRKGMAVDPVTLQARLKEKNLPPEVYSTGLIMDLIAQVPTSANIKSYAELVAEKSLLRKMIRANEEIAGACYNQKEDIADIMNQAEKKIFEISQKRQTGDFVPIRQIVLNAMDKIEYASHIKGNVTGISTGFTDLDSRTAGFQPSDFILIAARPSMGKTALALNIAQYAVLKENRCVAIFSLEMSKEQLTNRLFAMESHVDSQKIRTGDMSEQEWADLIESAGLIGESKLIIDDTPAISVQEMRSKCRKYKMEFGLEMIMIDYLQLMSGIGRGNESRQQEISDISRSLKALARELNVPVVSLSQLSRAVESRADHRPMLSDLRESGAIEQDADVVMFIYRDDYYNQDSVKKGVAEVIIAKQRNGPIGTVELSWNASLTKFANLER